MALKPEYEDLYQSWLDMGLDRGCECFINPPCGFCTHEGHPYSLDENDDAWENELIAAVRSVVE